MLKFTKKIYLTMLSLTLIFQCQNLAFAQYEVFKAKTVENEKQIVEQNDVTAEIPVVDDDLPDYNTDDSLNAVVGRKIKSILNNRKNKKNKADKENIEEENIKEVSSLKSSDSADNSVEETKMVNPKSYENQKVDDSNKFKLNAEKVSYDEGDGNIYATGDVEIIACAKKTTIKADEAILDKKSQTIKLTGNVRVVKEGAEMRGESLLIDLNEENVLMNNPSMDIYMFNIQAQEGFLIADDIQAINGVIKSNKRQDIMLQSSGFRIYDNVDVNQLYQNNTFKMADTQSTRKQSYSIHAKDIVLTCYKDHNSLLLKKADIYYNKHKILANTDFEIFSDKEVQRVETNMLELGNLRNFGMYAGYGFVFRAPKGQIVKLMPAVTYGKRDGSGGIGVGIIGRYLTKNARIDAGFSTSTSNLVVKGRYRFGDNLRLQYGRNAYISEGFLGSRRPGYAAQLEYRKSYTIKDLDVYYNQGVYAGFFSEYKKHDLEHAYSTMRFRYMNELRKTFFSWENKEQDLKISFNAMAQAEGTLYGSGQTQAVARIGPYITTKVKNWESSIGYMLSGIHGDSPFWFDKYMYGRSAITFNEKIKLSKYISLGYRAYVNPQKDNYQNRLLTESRIYALIGPEDLKMAISYDMVRDTCNMDFMFILGSDSTKINFDRLITKNIDRSNDKRDFYKKARINKVDL